MSRSTFTTPAAPAATIPLVAVPVVHPEQPYSEEWSSTICATHEAWVDRLRAERRARLATSETMSASVSLVAIE